MRLGGGGGNCTGFKYALNNLKYYKVDSRICFSIGCFLLFYLRAEFKSESMPELIQHPWNLCGYLWAPTAQFPLILSASDSEHVKGDERPWALQ